MSHHTWGDCTICTSSDAELDSNNLLYTVYSMLQICLTYVKRAHIFCSNISIKFISLINVMHLTLHCSHITAELRNTVFIRPSAHFEFEVTSTTLSKRSNKNVCFFLCKNRKKVILSLLLLISYCNVDEWCETRGGRIYPEQEAL